MLLTAVTWCDSEVINSFINYHHCSVSTHLERVDSEGGETSHIVACLRCLSGDHLQQYLIIQISFLSAQDL